jgi:pimeloyl-ACP methyl ester carboxylesterase
MYMRRRNVFALLLGFSFYVGFGWWLTINQEQIVYQPWSHDFANCPALATAERVTHQGTRLYVANTDGPTVVLYHGNAGSACDRAFLAEQFTAAGYGYILVVYAGYSNDPVPPTHERIRQDVQNVIDYLKTNNIGPVAVVGESIGAGVAAYHTSLLPPERLLLISPFTNLADVAATRFWFYPTRHLVDNAYDVERDLATFPGPTTIIHGTNDRIIPFRLGETLYHSLTGTKTLVPITDAHHNNLFTSPATYRALAEFLALPNE